MLRVCERLADIEPVTDDVAREAALKETDRVTVTVRVCVLEVL